MDVELKAAITVAEMARMLGFSRSRFYQLIGKAFPQPSRDETGRPFYDEEAQKICLEVRRRNCGIDGRPILFYAPRSRTVSPVKRSPKPKTEPTKHTAVLDAVHALGLTTINAAQVDQIVKELFPSGIQQLAHGDVVRAVFLRLQRRDSPDNVGR